MSVTGGRRRAIHPTGTACKHPCEGPARDAFRIAYTFREHALPCSIADEPIRRSRGPRDGLRAGFPATRLRRVKRVAELFGQPRGRDEQGMAGLRLFPAGLRAPGIADIARLSCSATSPISDTVYQPFLASPSQKSRTGPPVLVAIGPDTTSHSFACSSDRKRLFFPQVPPR